MNLGSSHNMNINETFRAPGQDFISSRQAVELRAQRSFIERGAVQLYGFSNSVAVRGDSQFHGSSSTNLNSHWPEGSFNARYNSLDDSSHGLPGRPNFSNKKPGLDSTTVISILVLAMIHSIKEVENNNKNHDSSHTAIPRFSSETGLCELLS